MFLIVTTKRTKQSRLTVLTSTRKKKKEEEEKCVCVCGQYLVK